MPRYIVEERYMNYGNFPHHCVVDSMAHAGSDLVCRCDYPAFANEIASLLNEKAEADEPAKVTATGFASVMAAYQENKRTGVYG